MIEIEPTISNRVLHASTKNTLNSRLFINGCQHSKSILAAYQREGIYFGGIGVDIPILFTEVKETNNLQFTIKRKDLENEKVRFFHFYSHRNEKYYLLLKSQIKPIKSACNKKSLSLYFVQRNRIIESKKLEKIITKTGEIIQENGW